WSGDLSLLHGRGPDAAIAQVEAIAAQLVPPVFTLERPLFLVVFDLRPRAALRRRRGRGRRGRELLLAARDLEVQAQRLAQELAQPAPLGGHGVARALSRARQQVQARRAHLRNDG